ncbi:MAG: SH3 domain-containing protein [Candidatus Saganbacteria bacterium]|nr:SH3 domain-containing protein [Candidatus Saganbacteria bacterium]
MKKIFISVFLLALLMQVSWAAPVSVSVEEATLRTGPGETYDTKTTLIQYTPLLVIQKEGNWYKVRDCFGTQGWVADTDISTTPTVMVRKARVVLRSSPSTRSAAIQTLYNGSILKVLKSTKSWLQVEIVDPPEGTQGWVNKRLVWGY